MAFVAGASRGIGRAIAVALARAGASVAVAARSVTEGKLPGTIHSVADAITSEGGVAVPVTCDVTSEASVDTAVAMAVDQLGGIDVLVANAGVMWLAPTQDTPLARWELCLRINLTGVFLVTRAEFESKVKTIVKDREALIRDRVRTIIAQSDPEKLGGGSEPGRNRLF